MRLNILHLPTKRVQRLRHFILLTSTSGRLSRTLLINSTTNDELLARSNTLHLIAMRRMHRLRHRVTTRLYQTRIVVVFSRRVVRNNLLIYVTIRHHNDHQRNKEHRRL